MMKKNILKISTLILMFILIISTMSSNYIDAALGSGFNKNLVNDGTVDSEIRTAGNNVGATIILIFQVLAATGVIFAGVKYMFSSTSKNKADIKKGLLGIAAGCILIFGGPTFINFVINVFKDIIK